MKYKRSASVFLAVLALIPAMMTAGCSEESHIITQHTSRPDGTATSKPYATNDSLTKDDITLTVWESKDGPDEFIRKAGDSFHKLYPNITIEYVNVEIPDAIINLKDKNSTIKRPDLFASPCDMAGELIANDLILPTIDTSFVNTVAMTSARDSVMYGDTMYGYPVSCETYALFYNKKFVDLNDIPSTWEGMIGWSKGFNTLYPGKYGFIFHADTVYYLAMLMSRDGNKLMSGKDYGLLNESAKYGMDLLGQMKEILPQNVTDFEYDDYDNLFLNGEAAFLVNGPWFVSKADASGVDYGIVNLPSFESGSKTYSVAGVRVMYVYSKSEHPKEADEFARYLLSEDMQRLRVKITGTLPAANVDIDEKLDGFVDQLTFSYALPNTPQMARFWEYGINVTKNVYAGKDPDEELKDYVDYLNGTDTPDNESNITDSTDSSNTE